MAASNWRNGRFVYNDRFYNEGRFYGQLIPKHKWSAIRLRFDEIIKLFNTTRRSFFFRPEVFGLDRHGQPFAFQGIMSDILQDVGLALLEIKQIENFAITFKESRENNIRIFGIYISIYSSGIYISIYLCSIYIYPSIYLSINQSIYQSFYLNVNRLRWIFHWNYVWTTVLVHTWKIWH